MAVYYELISAAIADLDNKSGKGRRAFYDHARATLADQLQKIDPPLSKMFIEHEQMALEDAISKVEADAIVDAKTQRERPLVFLGFLILSAVWIGDLFYKPLTFSDWYDWLRLAGLILFPALTILSYFIMQTNWSTEQEDRAYIVWAPIILVGAVLVSVALYFISGWLATTPSWAGRYYNFVVSLFSEEISPSANFLRKILHPLQPTYEKSM